MPHGAPDYSNVKKTEFTIRLDDMAEMVARLDDLSSLQRGGEVIFREGFAHGIERWDQTLAGTGAVVALNTDIYYSYGYSAKLVGGSDGGLAAQIATEVPLLTLKTFGQEALIRPDSNVDIVGFHSYARTGSYLYEGHVWIYKNAGIIYIQDENSDYQTILTDIQFPDIGQAMSFVKLVVDVENERYSHMIFNNHRVGLTDYGLIKSVDTSQARYELVINVFSESGQNGELFVDNVFITRNEY